MNVLTQLPSYPMRPMNGGPLDRARPKRGEWVYEPKINGWRVLLNTRTGEMFNRHGEYLTIAHEFKNAAKQLQDSPWEWLDCEGLARRHALDRGKLYVLDYIESYDKTPYRERHDKIIEEFWRPEGEAIGTLDHYSAEDAIKGWGELQEINKSFGVEYYEGFVAKRVDSPYTTQLRNPSQESPYWIKHRWEF